MSTGLKKECRINHQHSTIQGKKIGCSTASQPSACSQQHAVSQYTSNKPTEVQNIQRYRFIDTSTDTEIQVFFIIQIEKY